MKKQYIVSFLFVSLGIAVIIINFYFAGQNLKEIAKEEAESKLLSSGAPISSQGYPAKAISLAGQRKKNIGMIQEEQTAPPKLIDLKKPADELGHIPDDYDYSKNEDIESQEPTTTEDLSAQEEELRVEPAELEIQELKAKGVIIQ